MISTKDKSTIIVEDDSNVDEVIEIPAEDLIHDRYLSKR